MRAGWSILAAFLLVPASTRAGRVPIALKMNLVQAQCLPEPPSIDPPGPCLPAFRFKSGVVELRTSKEPGPTCPKTGQPSELPGGTATLTGVTKDGSAYTGSLMAEVTYKTTFGTDPNGTCPLQNVQITIASLTGTLTCRTGRCRGSLYAVACLPKQCSDTPLITELTAMRVCDGTLCLDDPIPNVNAVAVPGLSVTTIATDVP